MRVDLRPQLRGEGVDAAGPGVEAAGPTAPGCLQTPSEPRVGGGERVHVPVQRGSDVELLQVESCGRTPEGGFERRRAREPGRVDGVAVQGRGGHDVALQAARLGEEPRGGELAPLRAGVGPRVGQPDLAGAGQGRRPPGPLDDPAGGHRGQRRRERGAVVVAQQRVLPASGREGVLGAAEHQQQVQVGPGEGRHRGEEEPAAQGRRAADP